MRFSLPAAAISCLTIMSAAAAAQECLLTFSSSPDGWVVRTQLRVVFGEVPRFAGIITPLSSTSSPGGGVSVRGTVVSQHGSQLVETSGRVWQDELCGEGLLELHVLGRLAHFRYKAAVDSENGTHFRLYDTGIEISNTQVGSVWPAAPPCSAAPGTINGSMVLDNGVATQSFIISPVSGQDRRVMVTAEEPVNPAFAPIPPRGPVVSSLVIDAGCQTGSLMVPGTPWWRGDLYGLESEPGQRKYVFIADYSGSSLATGYLALTLSPLAQ
jgi:hypothetical protein